MDLLEEGNLLLQTLNASLQVQPGQSGIVNILDTDAETEKKIIVTTNRKCKKVQREVEIERKKVVDERDKRESCVRMERFIFDFGL